MTEEHITVNELIPIDRYRAYKRTYKITLHNTWVVGGLLYGYRDRYNIECIALNDIIERS